MADNNEELTPGIHNINVTKLGTDRFKVIFGTKTEIPNLYSALTEMEVDRALLEHFVKNAQAALAE